MTLLLDTHTILWFCEGNPALGAKARIAIEDERNMCMVSHASAWEIAIKISLGKLTLQVDFDQFFPGVIEANGWQILATEFRHYQELLKLPSIHRDPFDRLLIAQARVEDLVMLSADPNFPAYGVPIIW